MQSKIAVAQMDCVVGDVDANLAKIANMAAQAKSQGANLVIFPELATTGYFISDRIAELAEPIPGPTTEALTDIAKQHDIWLITGMAEAAGDEYYNTSVLASPEDLDRWRRVATYLKDRRTDLYRRRAALT